jgi:hypothetical protein
MSETKTRVPDFPLDDDLPADHLPEPVALTPEQIAARNALIEQDRLRRADWDAINKALRDDAMSVTRGIGRWYRREGDQERHTERVLSRYASGSFLIDRLGAIGVVDQDLVVVLLDLRRRLIDEYGDSPATMMLIDRTVAAYQDFIRIAGWTGNAALMVEHEFFGVGRPSAHVLDRYGREAREIRGLSVEEHINRLSQDLIPLAERCARTMREALAALETLRSVPSPVVERSRPIAISVRMD